MPRESLYVDFPLFFTFSPSDDSLFFLLLNSPVQCLYLGYMKLAPYTLLVVSLLTGTGLGGLCLRAQQPQLRLNFDRQNNFTYSTRLDLDYQLQVGAYRLAWNAHHDNIYNSNRAQNAFVQAYLQSRLWQYYRLGKQWEVASWWEYDHFFSSENYRTSLYGGVKYNWNDWLELTPLIGYSWDYWSGRLDRGFSPALWVRAQYAWPDGLAMQWEGFARVKHIDPRRQKNLMLQTLWTKAFDSQASLAFGFRAGSNEINDYRSASVQRIRSDTLNPMLTLRYELRPGMYWDSENSMTFTDRGFGYDPLEGQNPEFNNQSFNQLDILTRQKLSYAHARWRSSFLYEYQYLGRRYDLENSLELIDFEFNQQLEREKQKDFFRERSLFEAQVAYQWNPRHTLWLLANNRYAQYDTPSEDNFDDHDELTYGMATRWESQWNRKFYTEYQISGNIRKYAFLFSERSRDNYTQYSLRLAMDFRWQLLDNLSMQGNQNLYVNYNIKDFEDINRTDRSTRNLETEVSLDYRRSNTWDMEFSFYRREMHVSYINWDRFTETTLDTNITYILSHKHTFDLTPSGKRSRLFADIGYRHFSLTRRFNTAMTDLGNQLVPINLKVRNLQTGPQTGIRWFQRTPASIDLNIWWQFQLQDNIFKERESFTVLSSSYREEVLQERKRSFRPFFNLRLNFWLYDEKKFKR